MQEFQTCPCMSGLQPLAPAQGKETLSLDLQELRGAPAWKPSAQHAGKRASSGEDEAAQLRASASPDGENPCVPPERRAALLRGPIWQSTGSLAALPK